MISESHGVNKNKEYKEKEKTFTILILITWVLANQKVLT